MNIQTIVTIAVLAVLGGLLVSIPLIQKIINIRRTPTTWISALPDTGHVEVTGKVGQKSFPSPINKSPCVLWQVEVKEERKSNKGTSWHTVYKQGSGEPFDLSDDTGTVQVRPANADLILNDVSVSDRLDLDQKEKLEEFGIKLTGFLGSEKKFRVYESLVAPEEQIYVVGGIQTRDGTKLFAAREGAPLFISDRGESGLLGALYKKVGMNFLYAALAAVVLLIIIARF